MCYTELTGAAVEREGGAINQGPLAGISIAIMKRTGIYIIKRTRPHYARSVEPKQHSQDMSKIAATLFHTTDILFYVHALETTRLS